MPWRKNSTNIVWPRSPSHRDTCAPRPYSTTSASQRQTGAKVQRRTRTFCTRRTPCLVGRAIAALAADPRVLEKSGGLYGAWTLAREYGFTDVDGSQPNLGHHFDFERHFQTFRQTAFRWTVSRPAPVPEKKLAPKPARKKHS